MQVKVLQNYEGYTQGDIVTVKRSEKVLALIRRGILARYTRQRHTNKMMKNYMNK